MATSISLKGATSATVCDALGNLLPDRDVYVSPVLNGWITVYDADCDIAADIDAELSFMGLTLCKACVVPGIAFQFCYKFVRRYYAFDKNGRTIDDYELIESELPIIPIPKLERLAGMFGVKLDDNARGRIVSSNQALIHMGTNKPRKPMINEIYLQTELFRDLFGIENLRWGYKSLFGLVDPAEQLAVSGFDEFLHLGKMNDAR